MARIVSPEMQGASGRCGDGVYYTVGDSTYKRVYVEHINDSATEGQLLQRSRQRCVQTLFRSVKNTPLHDIENIAAKILEKRSGYHLFLKWNMNAFGKEDYIDYSKLRFTDGSLQLPDDFRVKEIGTDHVCLEWGDNSGSATAGASDRLQVVAIFPDEPFRAVLLDQGEAVRKGGGARIPFPQLQGKTVHLYGFFASETAEAFSLDRYFKIDLVNTEIE